MIGRLLCRLGLHGKAHVWFHYDDRAECDRCGRGWYL